MSLLKLWNTIRGRSNSDAGQTQPEVATAVPEATTPYQPIAQPVIAAKPIKPTKQRLNLFGGGNPHAPLCKLIRTMTARTVIEIGVQDGSRAIAVMETLMQNLPPAPVLAPLAEAVGDAEVASPTAPAIRYIAVDQFEMAGSETTLKQFHKTLRESEVRATVYPEPIDRALMRVAHTIGAVDLVLIAIATEQWQTPANETLLKRICHASTVVLYDEGSDWQRWQAGSAASTKRAA